MANLYELTEIKEELLRTLLTNYDICALLTNEPVERLPALDLRYEHVFPYSHVPDTAMDARTYVTFEVYTKKCDNGAVKQVGIDVYVFSHYDLMNVDGATARALGIKEKGVRTDILAAKIDEVLNGRDGDPWYGLIQFDALDPQAPIHPAEHYSGTRLSYIMFAPNRAGERVEIGDRRPSDISG